MSKNRYDRLFRLQEEAMGALRVLSDEMYVKGLYGHSQVEAMRHEIDRLVYNATCEEDDPQWYCEDEEEE